MKEQIYKDFTEKLLPKIGEGIQITKDYFIELFGRYVKYLIVSDSILAVVCLVLSVVSYKFLRKGITQKDEEAGIPMIIFSICGLILGIVFFLTNINYLIKDIYIPEVRIIQEIQANK